MQDRFKEFWIEVFELVAVIVGCITQIVGVIAVIGGIIGGLILGIVFDPLALLLIPSGLLVGPILMKLGMALNDWVGY